MPKLLIALRVALRIVLRITLLNALRIALRSSHFTIFVGAINLDISLLRGGL